VGIARKKSAVILVWGIEDDPPTAAICAALRRRGTCFFMLDQDRADESTIETHHDHVKLRCGNAEVDFASIRAAFIRPYAPEQLMQVDSSQNRSSLVEHAQRLTEWMWAWADTSTALVFNRPSAMESNHSKPWQLVQIETAGFRVAETLITNDPAAARRFWRIHREVICKSISSERSIVRRLDARHAARWSDLRHSPTQFQRWIDGTDVRVHVVGVQTFACEIRAAVDDYRYATVGREVSPCLLPDEWVHRCVTLAQATGLSLAGIDLRITSSGEWFCFEVNPSPAFTFFGEQHSSRVADAVAKELSAFDELAPEHGRDKKP
jgi:hypothetical protein